MKKRKIIILLLITILLSAFAINVLPRAKADSGFDTSYDSGGSWGGDSGGSDFDSGSSGNGKYTKNSIIILVIILIAMPSFVIYTIFIDLKRGSSLDIGGKTIKINSKNKIIIEKRQYNKQVNTTNQVIEIDENTLKKYIPNINKEQFLIDRYNDYLKIQNDWMNFNYEGLRENLTDELYNQYEMQLETLKTKNQKNVMGDFVLKDKEITDIKEENNLIEVTVEMIISLKDYIEQNGKVVRGNKKTIITHHYILKFVINKNSIDNKCPNCSAPISDNGSQRCDYCNSIISKVGNKWILSKKESKRQW